MSSGSSSFSPSTPRSERRTVAGVCVVKSSILMSLKCQWSVCCDILVDMEYFTKYHLPGTEASDQCSHYSTIPIQLRPLQLLCKVRQSYHKQGGCFPFIRSPVSTNSLTTIKHPTSCKSLLRSEPIHPPLSSLLSSQSPSSSSSPWQWTAGWESRGRRRSTQPLARNAARITG